MRERFGRLRLRLGSNSEIGFRLGLELGLILGLRLEFRLRWNRETIRLDFRIKIMLGFEDRRKIRFVKILNART